MKKTGVAELPLHYGQAPRWLFDRMVRLSREISRAIVYEYGPEEFIKRMADPYWFQAFGCVLGFDWHSSGLTTTACGALKQGLKGLRKELGVFIAGGKGSTSRGTPQEIEDYADRFSLNINAEELIYASKLAAKVDNTALQDGYNLYHHSFLFTNSGLWTVIQQGMNVHTRWARRYHWLSEDLESFVCEPHKAICCDHKSKALNLIAKESEEARDKSVILSREMPDKLIKEMKDVLKMKLPGEHRIFFQNLKPDSLKKVLLSTYQKRPEDFEGLLGIYGVGPKTIRALALLSELIYDAKASRRDPVKYSFAHGGKDGHPFPVDRAVYDKSIEILRGAVEKSKLALTEKRDALKRIYRYY